MPTCIAHCSVFPYCRRSLCEGLLQKSPSNRLGCSRGRHGVMEVKIHPWFNSINWRRMESGRIKPEFTPDPHAVYAKVRIRTIRRLSEYIINHGRTRDSRHITELQAAMQPDYLGLI